MIRSYSATTLGLRSFTDSAKKGSRVKLTKNQRVLRQAIEKHTMTICNGAAGTGKTWSACLYAAEQLAENKVQKIVLTRPSLPIGDSLGYLKGSMDDKMGPFVAPMIDVFNEQFDAKEVKAYREEGKIEIVPLQFVQGRTFKNSIVIADEMQNSTVDQMFMLITRLGENCKMIITGDSNQELSGYSPKKENGLRYLIDKVESISIGKKKFDVKIVYLGIEDVKRHPLVAELVKIFQRADEVEEYKKPPATDSNAEKQDVPRVKELTGSVYDDRDSLPLSDDDDFDLSSSLNRT